jgi:hypothetical protein
LLSPNVTADAQVLAFVGLIVLSCLLGGSMLLLVRPNVDFLMVLSILGENAVLNDECVRHGD